MQDDCTASIADAVATAHASSLGLQAASAASLQPWATARHAAGQLRVQVLRAPPCGAATVDAWALLVEGVLTHLIADGHEPALVELGDCQGHAEQ